MKRAGAIIRVSTERQLENTSPETQRLEILRVARNHGFFLDEQDIWTVAESGASKHRKGFQLALEAAEKGTIERIYVHKIDRLGRDVLEMLGFLDKLKRLGIELWIVDRGKLADQDDLGLLIEAVVAHDERRRIQNRTLGGLKSVIAAGKYCGGIVAYGYRANPVTKYLEIDPEDAMVVRQIFSWCVDERLSTISIADRLNALNIPTRYSKDGRGIRGKKTQGIWRPGRVLQILKNESYYGNFVWGKRSKKSETERELIQSSCPAIIDKQTWEVAQQVLRSNFVTSSRNSKAEYLLRGLMKCEKCGLTYTGSIAHTKSDGETAYYRCTGAAQHKAVGLAKRCIARGIRGDLIEGIVWGHVRNFCKNPQHIVEAARRWRASVDTSKIDAEIERIERAIADLDKQQDNLILLFRRSVELDTAAFDRHLFEIKTQQAELRRMLDEQCGRLDRIAGAETVAEEIAMRLARLSDRVDQMNFRERQKLVQELVVRITIGAEPYQNNNGEWTRDIHIIYRHDEVYADGGESDDDDTLDALSDNGPQNDDDGWGGGGTSGDESSAENPVDTDDIGTDGNEWTESGEEEAKLSIVHYTPARVGS